MKKEEKAWTLRNKRDPYSISEHGHTRTVEGVLGSNCLLL
jgi:hypothetical protein